MISIYILSSIIQLIAIHILSTEAAPRNCFSLKITDRTDCFYKDDGESREVVHLQSIQATPTASLHRVNQFGSEQVALFIEKASKIDIPTVTHRIPVQFPWLIHYYRSIPKSSQLPSTKPRIRTGPHGVPRTIEQSQSASKKSRQLLRTRGEAASGPDEVPWDTSHTASQIVFGTYEVGTTFRGSVADWFGTHRENWMLHRDPLVLQMYQQLSAVARHITELGYIQRNISPSTVLVTTKDGGKLFFQNSMLHVIAEGTLHQWCRQPVDIAFMYDTRTISKPFSAAGGPEVMVHDMYSIVRTMAWLYDELTGANELKLQLYPPADGNRKQWRAYSQRINTLESTQPNGVVADILVTLHRMFRDQTEDINWTVLDEKMKTVDPTADNVKNCQERLRRFGVNPAIRKYATGTTKLNSYKIWKNPIYTVMVRNDADHDTNEDKKLYFGVCYEYIQTLMHSVTQLEHPTLMGVGDRHMQSLRLTANIEPFVVQIEIKKKQVVMSLPSPFLQEPLLLLSI